MKLVVSIIKPGIRTLGRVEITDPEPGEVATVISDLLEAARRAAPSGGLWPIQIDICEAP